MKNHLTEQVGIDVYKFIKKYIDIDSQSTLILSTSNLFNIENSSMKNTAIVNFTLVNNIRYINKFFITVNNQLENENIFIGCAETFTARKNRNKINSIPIIRTIYFSLQFLFMRVTPKIWGLKKIYFFFTRGKNRLLSKAEILGRLVSCGFEIIEYKTINGLLFFAVKKIKIPISNSIKPSYGPLYKMPRLGKNGKIIGVYKFRTMHPYAEFLQDYIIKTNGYSSSGKPADDFRLTPWGKYFRKYWIDEVPQLINVLKGELKIVGVRPISQRYFQDIPKDLQLLRIKYKPGCIPPYVALNKSGCVEDVLNSERQYLIDKTNKPYSTDFKYFFTALYNILIRRKRSA